MAEGNDRANTPTYLGMVVCDNIIQDPETKKYYLMGTTARNYARSFPARYQKMCVYAVLTGIHERIKLTLKLVRVDPGSMHDEVLMSIPGTVEAPDPLAVAELTLGLRNLVLPKEGEYRFQLWCDEVLLGERKISLLLLPPTPREA